MPLERGEHTNLEIALARLSRRFARASDQYKQRDHTYTGIGGNSQEDDESLPPDQVLAGRMAVIFEETYATLLVALLEHRILAARALNPQLEGLSDPQVSRLIEQSIRSESIGQLKTPLHPHP